MGTSTERKAPSARVRSEATTARRAAGADRHTAQLGVKRLSQEPSLYASPSGGDDLFIWRMGVGGEDEGEGRIRREKTKRKGGSRTPPCRQAKARARVRCSAEQGTGIAVCKWPRSLQSPRPRRRATSRGRKGSAKAEVGGRTVDSAAKTAPWPGYFWAAEGAPRRREVSAPQKALSVEPRG